jgi:hypothetical protein
MNASSVMTAPDFSADTNGDLIRRIIEAAAGYERLCGFRPTCIHANGPILKALVAKGFRVGTDIAGMKIIASPESIADMAICSRDDRLFYYAAQKPWRGKAKQK